MARLTRLSQEHRIGRSFGGRFLSTLAHPTPEERVKIWTNVAASWKDSFTLPVFLEESKYLTTVPLAKEGGMTMWILPRSGELESGNLEPIGSNILRKLDGNSSDCEYVKKSILLENFECE